MHHNILRKKRYQHQEFIWMNVLTTLQHKINMVSFSSHGCQTIPLLPLRSVLFVQISKSFYRIIHQQIISTILAIFTFY